MANPFQRYQSGGFEPVQGIAQAGANIGQMLGGGFANFGGSLAKGIMAYNENMSKKSAAEQEAQIFGSQLLQQRNALIEASGIDAETAGKFLNWDGGADDELDTDYLRTIGDNPFLRKAKMLQPALDKLEKVPTMGLSAALSTINAAKGSIGMMEQQDKLDAMVAQARLERIAAGLPDTVQKERDLKTPEVVVDPNNPFFKGVKDVKDALTRQFPDNPDRVARGIKEYIDNTSAEIDKSGATAAQKVEFNNAIAAYREGLRTDTGELTDYGQEDEFVQKSLADAYAESQKGLAASAPAKTEKKVNVPKVIMPEPEELKALREKRDAALAKVKYYDTEVLSKKDVEYKDMHQRHRDEYAKDAAKYEEQMKGVVIPEPETPLTEDEANIKLSEQAATARRKPLELNKKLNELGSQILSTVTDDFRSRIANGEQVTIMDIGKAITEADIKQNPTTDFLALPAAGFGAPHNVRLPSKYTPARNILDEAAKKLGIRGDTPITAEQMLALQKFMKKGVETQTAAAVEAGKKAEGITPQTVATDVAAKAEAAATPAAPAEKGKAFSIGRLNLGTELYDDPLNATQKEAAAREFFKAKFGAVPVGFTDMYRKMYPEATVRTTEVMVNGQKVPIMIDAKGNATPLIKEGKEPDIEKIAAGRALTFQNTEIADGVRLSGIFSGTVSGAQAFRKDYAHMANVRSAIKELIDINEMGYESLSPTARARADQLQSEIIAALRVPIIGPGQVAVPEQEILQRIVDNPTKIFNLESASRAALKGLADRVDRELVNWPKSMGLEVNMAGNRSQTIKQLRLKKQTEARIVGESQ